MPFQIRPLREFLVKPALPAPLKRLDELAHNILWSWDHNIRALFRRLDPVLWKSSGHNPILMLGRIPQASLERAATDPRYLAVYRKACEIHDAYMGREPRDPNHLIAYFSMEYGLLECMPIYSGGLGVLSGDHLKAASDADIPLVGVGLLYQKGYLQQTLNPDGWQQERYPVNDFYTLPVAASTAPGGGDVRVSVKLPDGLVHIKVWHMNAGRVKLYLLDTNIEDNPNPNHRDITDQLYGGDSTTRLRQEIVLGIGGLRALKALGLDPTVFHMNEGHSAFLAIERVRVLMQEENLSFEEALEACRQNNVFTTHTAVPAGFDLFDPGLMYEYFHEYAREAGIAFEQLLAIGRRNPHDPNERFSMAITAIKGSAYRNAVSVIHREVSKEMFQDLWPNRPVWEVPITSITNGTHLPTWLNGDLATMYDRYLQPDWRERYMDPKSWELVKDIPGTELWEARRHRRRLLVTFVRERLIARAMHRKASSIEIKRMQEVLDPDTFTIGFARRFATYKRATLLFRDVERLKRILNNSQRPVQIVIAGKAHPKDHPGKLLIRDIVQLTKNPELARRIVFLEDYGIEVARELVQGVDLWLNNPRRGEEACGTSGMKAGINGVLNLSILDGWFDEAYEVSGGWAIGDREPYSPEQDEIHATAVYSLLENEIVPMFYHKGDEGYPEEWIRRIKQSLYALSPWFNSHRMVEEYMSLLYEPAHAHFHRVRESGFSLARHKSQWKAHVERVWDQVRFLETGPGADASVLSGLPIRLRAVVELAGLLPEDVRVEAVVGRVDAEGHLESPAILQLHHAGEQNQAFVFEREMIPQQTGRLGYTMRISPNHTDDPLGQPCNALLKWT